MKRAAILLFTAFITGGCGWFEDPRPNDARLVIEVIKAAAEAGAIVANYAAARGLVKSDGRVSGIEVEETRGGRRFTLSAHVVVNATGVWSDEVARLADRNGARKLRPSKGIHVVMPDEGFNCEAAVLIPSLGEQRFLFIVPWLGRTLIGTTDTDYGGPLDEPVADPDEINRVLESAARYFPRANLCTERVISTTAGLRPLVSEDDKSTSELSRKDELIESDSGLISMIGGKLTTYRRIAERVVDRVMERLGRARGKCMTGQIELAGGVLSDAQMKDESPRMAAEYALPVETVEHLMHKYAGNSRVILEITRESPDLRSPLIEGLPHIAAEVVYAARYEMAMTVEDFLARRTRIALLSRDHGSGCVARVGELIHEGHEEARRESPA